MSELSQFDDGNVLTHGTGANRKKRGRRPLDYPDEKNKVSAMIYKHRCLDSDQNLSGSNCYEQWHPTVRLIPGQLSQGQQC